MDDRSAARERQRFDTKVEEKEGRPARDIAPGERWAFLDHRTLAEVMAVERQR